MAASRSNKISVKADELTSWEKSRICLLIYGLYEEYSRLILATLAISIFKPETKTKMNKVLKKRIQQTYKTGRNKSSEWINVLKLFNILFLTLKWVSEDLTGAQGLYVGVFAERSFFGLLHQQPVHSSDGRGDVIRRQVKWGRLLARLLLQTTEIWSDGTC